MTKWRKRRQLRRTCPRCRQRTLARFQRTEGVGGPLLTITRYCVNCGYHDGFVRKFDPEREIERTAAMYGEPYVLGDRRG